MSFSLFNALADLSKMWATILFTLNREKRCDFVFTYRGAKMPQGSRICLAARLAPVAPLPVRSLVLLELTMGVDVSVATLF